MLIRRVHNYLLTLNNQFENSFTDKELHFLIVGAFGLGLVFVLHPIFLWLAKHDHTMIISFLYVFTVVLVLTFAIEIGQGYYGTGAMEFDDVVYGVTGFLSFFLVFAVIRGFIHLVMHFIRSEDEEDY